MMTIACERSQWSNEDHKGSDRYDAWVDALEHTYGYHQLGVNTADDFKARIQSLKVGNFSVVECICDPCRGERRRPHIGVANTEMLGIQLVLAGKEHFEFNGKEFELSAGDVFFWDNVHEVRFDVLEKLHKVSAILPLARFREWLPSNWNSLDRHIPASSPNAFLMRSHLLALLSADYSNAKMSESALTEATIALLLGAGVHSLGAEDITLRDQQLRIVQEYIEANLKNPDLSLMQIAEANRISVRYVHWLFRQSGDTAQQYIIKRRLERCRQDFGNPAMENKSITQIAFSWGFSDSAHFSKRFKATYDMSPTEYRKLT